MRPEDRETALGPVYLRTLLRVNLTTSLAYFLAFLLIMFLPPVLFAFVPVLSEWRIFGLPLPWLHLGVTGFPLLLALAWRYLREVEANEAEFSELVEGS